MVVRIAPSGGRTLRKGGAISLAGADVPVVTPARDPGLNVPLIPISSGGEVEEVIGQGLQSLGNVLHQGADLALQVVQRDEGLARDADETAYSDTLQDTIRDLQKTGDLSDSALVEAIGEKMFQEKQRILDEHQGGKISSTLLGDRLTKMHNKFADTLAVLNINAADTRLNLTINRKISSITRDVLTDPDVLMSEDPLEPFRFHVGQLEEEIDFLELRPDQARIVRQAGRSEIALSMITPLIKNGQFERAKVLLRSDEIAEVLSPGQHRDAIQRVIDAERKLSEVSSEADELMEMAARLEGPGASEETIRATAKELKGIGETNNVQFFSGPHGGITAINKDTLEVTEVVKGSTAEERAEAAKLQAKFELAGKLEMVQAIANAAGVELTVKGATISTDGEKDTSKTTKSTSTKEEGETPDEKPLVAPISEESITLPFGDKPEDEPGEDMKAVLGHLALARMYLLLDDPTSSNSHRGMASHIIENSTEIQNKKIMDRAISNPETLSWTGIPVGGSLSSLQGTVLESPSEREAAKQRAKTIDFATASEFEMDPNATQGELAAVIRDRERRKAGGEEGVGRTVVRSEEERARRRSIGAAAGAAQVEADEQLSFVKEAQGQIKFILAEIDNARFPLVGGVGAIRAAGQAVTSLISDLGMTEAISFANDLVINNSDPDPETGETGLEFSLKFFANPTLSSLDIIEYSIGVIIARLSTSAGRIPVDLIKRSIALVGLKGLKGEDVVVNRLNFVNDNMLQPRVDNITDRFPELRELEEPEETLEETEAFEDEGIPPGTPRFRVEGGELIPVTPDAASGGGSSELPFSDEVIQGSEGVEDLQGEGTNLSLEEILVPKAQGESTVDETVAAVDQVFGGGEFLKRIAKVESDFGTVTGTFRKSGGRGIWQLDKKTGFKETKNVKSHPGLKKAHEKISEEFGIDWNEVSFEDLSKPLISALAARLFLLTIPEKIPDTLKGQAAYWKKHYNTIKGKGTAKKFIVANSN